MQRLLVTLALGVAACSFDTSIDPGVEIHCTGNDCPRGFRCRTSTQRCVKDEGFDDLLPGIVDGSAQLSFVPTTGGMQPSPTALGPFSEARLAFRSTEPLDDAPVLITTPAISCFPRVATLDSFEYGCTLPMGSTVPDGPVQLEAVMQDVALNRAQVPVPVTLTIDSTPPPSPDPMGVTLIRAPWGSKDTAYAPLEAVEAIAGAVREATSLVARSGTVARGLLPVRPDGAVDRAALSRLDTPELEVAAVDGAGNASAFVRVRNGRWVAAFRQPQSQLATNPHVLTALGATGAAPATEGTREVVLGATASGLPAWRRMGEQLPVSQGNPVLAYDAARARTLRFGGVQVQRVFFPALGQIIEVGPPLGLPDVYESAGTGWVVQPATDLESDGNPPGRVDAVAASSVAHGLVYLQGGNSPNPYTAAADPTAGALLADTWAWNGRSWSRLPDGPARRGASAYFDDAADELTVLGGSDDAGPHDDAWVMNASGWHQLPLRLPQAVAWAALAHDPATSRAFMFGGRLADGGVSSALWQLQGNTVTHVEPDGGAWPPARSHAAAAFVRGGEVVLAGGTAADGRELNDAWRWSGSWAPLPAFPGSGLPADAGRVRPALVFETARDTLVLNVGVATYTRGLEPSASWATRTVEAFTSRWDPPLACANELGGCVTFDQAPYRAFRLEEWGWRQATELGAGTPPGSWRVQMHAAWDDARKELITVPFENRTFLWSADAGWRQHVTAPLGYGNGSHMAATTDGVLFVSTTREGPTNSRINPQRLSCPVGGFPYGNVPPCPHSAGDVYRWTDAGWVSRGKLDSSVTPTAAPLELNWAQWVPFPSSPPHAHGLQITTAYGPSHIELANALGNIWLWLPAAAPTFTHRWASDGGLGWPGLGDLSAVTALSAIAPQPERGTAMSFGGMTTASDRPTALMYVLTETSSRPVNPAVVDGFGAPPGRVAANMAWDPTRRSMVMLGGGTNPQQWGFWQTSSVTPTLEQLLARSCNPLDVFCLHDVLRDQLPFPDLADTWLLGEALERPSLQGRIELGAVQLAKSTLVTRVAVRANVNAMSTQAGVRALWWNRDHWEPLASAAMSPAALSGSAPLSMPLKALESGGTGLYVRLQPEGTNGPAAATISATDFEVELEYTLPQ